MVLQIISLPNTITLPSFRTDNSDDANDFDSFVNTAFCLQSPFLSIILFYPTEQILQRSVLPFDGWEKLSSEGLCGLTQVK